MKIFEAHLAADICWRIHRDDAGQFFLQSLPGWSLLNPLVYPTLATENTGHYRLEAIVDDSILIETNVLLFASSLEEEASAIGFRILTDFFPHFLDCLRQASKQAGLAQAHFGGLQTGPAYSQVQVPSPQFPSVEPNGEIVVFNSDLNVAITKAYIEQADAMAVHGDPPLFGSVLLDAVQAFLDRDDRRTILYAAMAVEIIGKAKLLAAGAHSVRVPKGQHKTVEHLYHVLSQRWLRRSLQEEHALLYQDLEKLYRARNALVHEGTSDAEMFPMNGEGALLALQCANAVFNWLGEPDDYLPIWGVTVGQVPAGWKPDFRFFYPKPLPRFYFTDRYKGNITAPSLDGEKASE